jgi:hypothetical protein
MTIKYKNLRTIFGDGWRANYLAKILDEALKTNPKSVNKNRGTHIIAALSKYEDRYVPVTLSDPIRENQDGSSRLMVMHMDHNWNTMNGPMPILPENQSMRVDIPLFFAYDREILKEYSLYHIRFKVSSEESRFTEDSIKPLQHGYVGITKRGILTRFVEHGDKARTNTGSLLHSVWHQLSAQNIAMNPVIQISGTADSLGKIYQMEEDMVAQYTLAPMGLNAIPGGMAGIKMMHKLRLLTSTKVGVDERDAAIERLQQGGFEHGSPCTHYRKGHYRKLADNRLTWVSPCWVNLKETNASHAV